MDLLQILPVERPAKKLKDMLDAVGKGARNIAEFGIGTNDSAKLSGSFT